MNTSAHGRPFPLAQHMALQIDRDPKHFPLILTYLRDGHVPLPEGRREQREMQVGPGGREGGCGQGAAASCAALSCGSASSSTRP